MRVGSKKPTLANSSKDEIERLKLTCALLVKRNLRSRKRSQIALSCSLLLYNPVIGTFNLHFINFGIDNKYIYVVFLVLNQVLFFFVLFVIYVMVSAAVLAIYQVFLD